MKWSQVVFLSEEITRNLKTSNPLKYPDSIFATQHLELKGLPLYTYEKMAENLKIKAMKELNLPEDRNDSWFNACYYDPILE